MTLHLQMSISIAGWMVTKCTSSINKQCCSHYRRWKGRTYFTIPPIFTTVEIILQVWHFLLLTTSLLQVLTKWSFQIRLNGIGNRLQKRIINTSGSSCLLRIDEKLISSTRQTSPLSSTNNSSRKTQPASDDKLI